MSIWKPTLPPYRKHKAQVFYEAAKTNQFIHQIGENPALRQKSKEVPVSKIKLPEMQAKFRYIKKCLLKYRKLTGVGRGITAIQIGIPQRFSVIYAEEKPFIIINPKITKKSKKMLTYPEMCMSSQPIIAPTVRPAWIEFDYYNERGKFCHWNTKDDTKIGRMMNRVFQHEIDHMDGIINIDKVESKKLIIESDPKFYDSATFEEV